MQPSPSFSITEPLDFIAASRLVLHLASRGPGRIEFLREASRLLLGFSGCESLLLIGGLEDAIARYEWRASRVPAESFQFRLRGDDQPDEQRSPSGFNAPAGDRTSPLPAWLDDLLMSVMGRRVGPKSHCVTAHGSYWSGDVAAELALEEEETSAPGRSLPAVRSLVVMPFDVTASVSGVLALLSGRKHVFSAHNVEFYEALAQTLGLAMDDRRAQHALRERVKELTCLYAVAKVLEAKKGGVSETLAEVARLLPPAWQFPEAVVARIRVDDAAFATGDVGRAVHRQEAPVIVDGVARGLVEVGYIEDRREFVEGAFLREESHLIAAVARELSLYVQRRDTRLEKSHLAAQVRQADRLATIGRLAAGVAHEINEPLGGILGFAQLARKSEDGSERVREDLDKIIRAALHAREIVRKLMLFARQSPPTRAWVRVNSLIDESLGLLSSRIRESGIHVERALDPACPMVFADAVQLNQVIVNLCVNAIQAMPHGGTLTLRTGQKEGTVTIAVEDTGTGIPSDVAKRIFDPFFTTKSPEQGTGLGLSVVHGIVTSHGGSIQFENRPGAGARFEVRLPVSSAPPAAEDSPTHA